MTEQTQNPTRLRKPRVPPTDIYVVENHRRFRATLRSRRRKQVAGLKRWYVPGLEGFVKTPYAANVLRKRRAARKVAHESRRRNRC